MECECGGEARRRWRRKWGNLAPCISLLILAGMVTCAGGVLSPTSPELTSALTDYFGWIEDTFPSYAVKMGFEESNSNRVGRVDPDDMEGWNGAATNLLHTVDNIQSDDLSPSDLFIRSLLHRHLSVFTNGYSHVQYGAYNSMNSMEGPHTYVTEWVRTSNFSTLHQYDLFKEKVKGLELYFTEAQEGMDRAIEEGTTNHELSVTGLRSALEAVLNDFGNSPFVKPYSMITKNLIDTSGLSESELVTLSTESIGELVSTLFAPVQQMTQYLTATYLPDARPESSVLSLPGGLTYYKTCLKWYLDEVVDENVLHTRGEEEVKRIDKEIQDLLMRLSGGKKKIDGMRHLKQMLTELPTENPTRGSDMVNKFRAIYTEVVEEMGKVVKVVGRVKEPEIIGEGSQYEPVLSYRPYLQQLVVNTKKPKKRSFFQYKAATLQEALPGRHYLQTIIIDKSPKFLHFSDNERIASVPFKLPHYSAFIRGWSLYSVQLGEDLKFYKDDYELFGKLTTQLLSAVRLVLDTGIHVKKWTRDEAKEYLRKYTILDDRLCEREIVRTVTWPGQGCAEKYGELKIMELRKKAEKKLGGRFELLDFHSSVLSRGVVPLPLLEEQVTKYIEDTYATIPQSRQVEAEGGGASRSTSVITLLTTTITLTLTTIYTSAVA